LDPSLLKPSPVVEGLKVHYLKLERVRDEQYLFDFLNGFEQLWVNWDLVVYGVPGFRNCGSEVVDVGEDGVGG
jgi:hypothetical protein